MIQLITWNIPYILKWELLRWKKWFALKHSEAGITHIQSPDLTHIQLIRDTLLSRSFFSEKKLLILEDMHLWDDFCSELYDTLQKKDDDSIVLICLSIVDKRLTNYKTLKKIVSKHEDYTLAKPEDSLRYLEEKYGQQFKTWALRYLFELKWSNISKSLPEIQKLTELYETIDKALVNSVIIPELDSTIFKLLDAYLFKQSKDFFNILTLVLDHENFYLISQWFLSNLRTHLYIEYMKSLWKRSSDISDILKLGKKAFLIGKSHKKSYKAILRTYNTLVDFDCDMKRWKLWSSSDDDIKKLYRSIFLRDFT